MKNFEITLSNGEHITIIAESWQKAIETFYKSHTGFSGVLTEIKLVNYGRIIYVQNTGDHETFAEHYGCRETTPLEVFTGKSLPPDGSLALSAKEVEQVNKAISEALKTKPHLNDGPTYEEMEMALLTEQEQNLHLDKEVKELGRICEEKDAKITELRKERDAFKQYMENTVKNSINSGSLQAEVDALKEQNGELIKQLIDYDVPLPKCAEFTGDAKQTEKSE